MEVMVFLSSQGEWAFVSEVFGRFFCLFYVVRVIQKENVFNIGLRQTFRQLFDL